MGEIIKDLKGDSLSKKVTVRNGNGVQGGVTQIYRHLYFSCAGERKTTTANRVSNPADQQYSISSQKLKCQYKYCQ